ncbi:MAG: phenylalanine--tRNA ligase subunit beta [Desulfobulbus sp.]|nr:phenylalanine--tRNA ligase subunit beta [Desulfobulbus sp.]
MKFTLAWLNEYIPAEGMSAAQIADNLTMRGLEVDSVTTMFTDLESITTARVVQVVKHPDADKLTVCSVDTGDETVQVVCGAPNVRPGMVTAIAKPGVKLPDGTKIKKAKVRGVVSEGMLCSARELGLNDDHQGLIEFPEDVSSGQPIVDVLNIRDSVIEVDLTPNRPDCACVRGIAREVSSFCDGVLKPLVPSVTPLTGTGLDFEVLIQEPALCPRYTARKLTNVTVGPSPRWLQQRLTAVGMRPINNIVDVTNYVMLECGQPMHAFDFSTLKGRKIIVRRPSPEENRFTTLDGSERQIAPDMLLICDNERPVAVAGVMGGLETEITETTTTILLESACFDPVSIRQTARSIGVHSESSYRFERGVDPDLADTALERAVNLIVELTGATADPTGIDVYPGKKEPLTLQLRTKRVCSLLGMQLEQDVIADHLRSIEFTVTELDASTLHVTVPSFRVDVERGIDLVEEVARLVGYNEIPTSLPFIRMDYPKRDELRSLRQTIAQLMAAQGFYEAINYSFVNEEHLDDCSIQETDPRRMVTRLLNPLSEDQSIMRSLLLPGLLENIRRNINFQRTDIRLFEIGKVFLRETTDPLPDERFLLCAVISGQRYPEAEPFYFANQATDFYDIKGAAVNLLHALRIQATVSDTTDPAFPQQRVQPYCDPTQACVIHDGGLSIGSLGAVHPKTLKAFGIKQPVYFLEIDLEQLQHLTQIPKQFTTLPKYPSVKRDVSLVVPDSVAAGALLEAIQNKRQKYLESIQIFDVYQGKPIQTGFKSVALSLTYRSATATLDDQSVDKLHNKIIDFLMSEFNAAYREGI